MNGFAIEIQSKKNLKQIGDKILLKLIKNEVKSKYQTFGKYIFLESSEKLKENILKLVTIFIKLMLIKIIKNGFIE